jgi:hypothetical protein
LAAATVIISERLLHTATMMGLEVVVVAAVVVALATTTMAMAVVGAAAARYEPHWDSLDARPLPAWYGDAKLGIFIHWGVYSVPAFSSEWIWHQWKTDQQPDVVQYMETNYPPTCTYVYPPDRLR